MVDMTSQAQPISFIYRNWRCETAMRTAVPKAVWFGTTEWHPEPGWFLFAYDLAKAEDRDFALKDCDFTGMESPGVAAISAERRRQVEVEGWTAEHDDEHDQCELSLAGAVYALSGSADSDLRNRERMDAIRELWPFNTHWLKPTGGREDLVKAGALIAAEIDRLDRAALTQEGAE